MCNILTYFITERIYTLGAACLMRKDLWIEEERPRVSSGRLHGWEVTISMGIRQSHGLIEAGVLYQNRFFSTDLDIE